MSKAPKDDYEIGYDVGWEGIKEMDVTRSRDFRMGFADGKNDANSRRVLRSLDSYKAFLGED